MPQKKKRLFLLPLLLLLVSIYFPAKATVIDSLKQLYEQEKDDSLKVFYLNELSYEYVEVNPTMALFFAEKAVELSTKIKSDFGLMRSSGQLGNAYRKLSNYPRAIEGYIQCEKLAEKLGDTERIRAINHNIGLIYHLIGQYEKAEKSLLKGIDLDRKANDEPGLAISLNSLGATYLEEKKYEKAKKVLLESCDLFLKTGNRGQSCSAYRNLGIVEKRLNNFPSAVKHLEKAVEYYILEEKKEKAGECLRILASLHHELKKTDKAIFYYEQSLKLAPEITQNELEGNNILYFMSEAYMKKGDKEKAFQTLQRGYKYYETFFTRLDSIKALEREKAFADAATKYSTEKTEKENKIQKLTIENEKAANSRKQIIIYSFVVGAVLLIGLLFFAIRSNIMTKRASTKIRAQKEQIEVQRDEIAEKNAEITSSIEYAKSLQDAILPDPAYIQKHLPHHFILWLPRDIVSGDFYWFFEQDNKLFLAAADCTGHGVPGAFVSMTCHNILNQVVIDQHEADPGSILHKVHVAVSNVFRREGALSQANDGMDIALVCIDKNQNTISYAGAMNELIQVSGSDFTMYKADRYAIGGRTPMDHHFKTHSISYKTGDWFYMFSDGYKDQFGGEHGKKYMHSNFVNLLQKISVQTAGDQRKALEAELTRWVKGFDRIDDVLVIGFRA
ncbi:MAG TPA: tetratricopeptide repeat protein [Flavobacteriales bacterium]|nr:tetratricopeptide repeat protein [Flavobacteriales bacterium]